MRIRFSVRPLTAGSAGLIHPKHIEGDIEIEHNGKLVFAVEDIPLVELGVELYIWLLDVQSGVVRDFHYESMNYEEDPLLTLDYDPETRQFAMSSELTQIDAPPVLLDDAISAAQEYLAQLREELFRRFSLDLDKILHEAAENALLRR